MDKKGLEKLSLEERKLLLLIGFFNFPVGFALYFYYNDKKDKEWYADFARKGAYIGLFTFFFIAILIAMAFICCYLNY